MYIICQQIKTHKHKKISPFYKILSYKLLNKWQHTKNKHIFEVRAIVGAAQAATPFLGKRRQSPRRANGVARRRIQYAMNGGLRAKIMTNFALSNTPLYDAAF
jgi:hypothetical protein